MISVGIDLVDTSRIRSLYERYGEKFLNLIYSKRELEEWYQRGQPIEYLAGRFALKEAFIKAAGHYIPWRSIEILADTTGKPKLLHRGEPISGSLSVSHEGNLAIGIVIYEDHSIH
ncbi:holo-ACP synthase [candidate division WOR-3 bacterium]|nr:holo-ACP synthase [candidate division WOR-3 bacterium]